MRTRLFVCLLVLCLATPLFAADKKPAGATLRFGNAKPEAILAFSWGVSNTTSNTGGGGGAGKATFSDFSFTKSISQLSSTLFDACATGKHFPQVTIDINDDKGNPVAQVKLTDVLVSSYQTGSGGDVPTESVSLNYAKVDYFVLIGM